MMFARRPVNRTWVNVRRRSSGRPSRPAKRRSRGSSDVSGVTSMASSAKYELDPSSKRICQETTPRRGLVRPVRVPRRPGSSQSRTRSFAFKRGPACYVSGHVPRWRACEESRDPQVRIGRPCACIPSRCRGCRQYSATVRWLGDSDEAFRFRSETSARRAWLQIGPVTGLGSSRFRDQPQSLRPAHRHRCESPERAGILTPTEFPRPGIRESL